MVEATLGYSLRGGGGWTTPEAHPSEVRSAWSARRSFTEYHDSLAELKQRLRERKFGRSRILLNLISHILQRAEWPWPVCTLHDM